MKKLFSLTNITLLVALSLSTIAAYYSIIGLTAIFAGAVIPIIVMGSILEIGKITTTVWLRKYWKQCSLYLKLYLVPAVVALAILTSMGIFGFLSKAHMDTGLVSGDSQAKLALIDEKIKTERDNIELARKALQQLDAQVDARLSRGDSEAGAERAVQIRRQQAGERGKLQKDIGEAQTKIAKLNEERAPIAAENRKIEAEVGPIKYVAALIYGDNPDNNLLERAVRWLIILLVVVFDPLAIALVLAANASREWDNKVAETITHKEETTPIPNTVITKEETDAINEIAKNIDAQLKEDDVVINETTHPYLYKTGGGFKDLKPIVYKPDSTAEVIVDDKKDDSITETIEETPIVETIEETPVVEPIEETPVIEPTTDNVDAVEPTQPDAIKVIPEEELSSTILLHSEKELIQDIQGTDSEYVIYEGKKISKNALREIKPQLFTLTADSVMPVATRFGIQFPRVATKGDMFMRVDVLPNRLFKFDGRRWFEVNKDTLDTYLDEEYMKFLIDKIHTGEYDIEILSEKEKEQIEYYLNTRNSL